MNLCLHSKQTIRISTKQQNSYIDIDCIEHEQGLSVEFHPSSSEYAPYKYMELREKDGHFIMFCFDKKSVKKHIDLNYWQDANVIWSKNFNIENQSIIEEK